MFEKFKVILGEDLVFYSAVVLLVAAFSFGLGRYSVNGQSVSTESLPIVFYDNKTTTTTSSVMGVNISPTAITDVDSAKYVASRKGSKYHLLWCPGATQMKEENKLYFATKEAAEGAGYTPAANCPGL